MKFKNTTSSVIEQIPTEDSIVVTTDTSLVGYCANNALYKVDKPSWHIVDEPNIGLIRNGILATHYATRFTFGSNDGAGGCKAFQDENKYMLDAGAWEVAWIRWKINFDDVDYVYVKYQRGSSNRDSNFCISDAAYDPSSARWTNFYDDSQKIYTKGISVNGDIIDVAQYTGVHWMYVATTYHAGSYNLYDVELRKADE